jgi:single-strand DNA-binding protein
VAWDHRQENCQFFSNNLIFTNMNALKNKVTLIGRLGAKPEVMNFETGRALARFTLATNEGYKDRNGQWQDNTQWHNINAWGKSAELVGKLLDKGLEVMLEGKLVNQSYETKSGEKRFSTVVELNEFLIISSKNAQ